MGSCGPDDFNIHESACEFVSFLPLILEDAIGKHIKIIGYFPKVGAKNSQTHTSTLHVTLPIPTPLHFWQASQ